MAGDQAEIEQKNRQRLEAFVVRARRVAEHSLADDWAKLVAFIDPKIGFRFENGEIRIRHELPPEKTVMEPCKTAASTRTALEEHNGGSCE
ncbi:hypothetical protein [Streptomyces goshikiensis]|uniref:hypothetical protein n=1 Tax=Streptomyces goshikiensis TaxID=1942 RepID=UPI003665E8F0